jgi:hypothetical protein
MVSKVDHLGYLIRVIKINVSVAGRVLVKANGTGK